MEYYSDIQKWNLAICNNLAGPREYYATWNESEKNKHSMISFISMIQKIKKKKQNQRFREQLWGLPEGRVLEEQAEVK